MKLPFLTDDRPSLPLVLTIALAATVLMLSWYGYRAVSEWQRSTAALIGLTVEDGAELVATALTRDMRGTQALVLASRDSGDYATQALADFSYEVASVFTRYSYPESFFGWRRTDGDVVFFNRASRTPPWARTAVVGRYPVVTSRNPEIAAPILERIRSQAEHRVSYAHFNAELAGVPYQIVARLQYGDQYREQLESVTGFTVNLSWVRERYFADIVSEVARMGESNAALDFAVLDDHDVPITGAARGAPGAVRRFPLQFFDPAATELEGEDDTPSPIWTLHVGTGASPTLEWATSGADTTLLAIAGTALGLAISFLLMAHSVRARASLAAMREEFVSIATHELKTPLATIRAASETMVRGRLAGDRLAEYALLLLQESKRLTRLVDNLLAYARVIDVRDLYQFERLSPAELIEDALQSFERQLAEAHFDVTTDIPHDLPSIRGDRTTLRLALDNLIDNAIRYSENTRSIRVAARHAGAWLTIEVADRGIGIAADEVERVKARFVRGRRATTHGSGLGLAIVSRVVADHGGRFDLDSTLGIGARAVIGLPTDAS